MQSSRAEPTRQRLAAAPLRIPAAPEIGAFGTVGLCLGVLGTRSVAARQIATTLALVTSMIPLGVGSEAAAGSDGNRQRQTAIGPATRRGPLVSAAWVACVAPPRSSSHCLGALVAISADIHGCTIAGVSFRLRECFTYLVFDGARAVGRASYGGPETRKRRCSN